METFLPLLEQFGSMHQHEGVYATLRNQSGSGDGFAKRGRCG